MKLELSKRSICIPEGKLSWVQKMEWTNPINDNFRLAVFDVATGDEAQTTHSFSAVRFVSGPDVGKVIIYTKQGGRPSYMSADLAAKLVADEACEGRWRFRQ
ncbi:hypothetical protein [Prosthecobacter sp.]|uniref:hypothetical protein n=1 Tax=Prosthecobacter sp. TaxID=1965333 RepID=UPI002AB8EDD0|nr:hypothetical protein [Prosthecobacter sp.]MDZ4402212.1 hypothetical protein [Prosthecobacter sp.]